jgi:protein tyrosine/serine phosphatase
MKIFLLILVFDIKAFCLSNFGKVSDNIYRGSFPSNEVTDFLFLKQKGIDTIINLEYIFSVNPKLLNNHDMTEHHFPVLALPRLPSAFGFQALKKAFSKTISEVSKGKTVYIHCLQGRDRTGILVSALMIRKQVCHNTEYDKSSLKNTINSTLDHYHFHSFLFPTLRQIVLSWTEDTPEWICSNK